MLIISRRLPPAIAGIAIGISADARNVDPQKIGAGAVIWSRGSLLLALFLGGMAASRMSMVWDRVTGLAQGALVWVVSLLVVLLLAANGVGLAVGVEMASGALRRSDAAPSSAAWISFFSTVLSLLAALAGAALGQHRAAVRVKNEVARSEVESREIAP